MKKSYFVLVCLIMGTLTGCISIPKTALYQSTDLFSHVQDGVSFSTNATVSIDSLEQKDISSQICQISDIYTKTIYQPGPNHLTLSINVTQRSYLENIQSKNSIFIITEVTDDAGEVILTYSICYSGSETILSSVTQQKIIEQITGEIRSVFKKVQKEYEKSAV